MLTRFATALFATAFASTAFAAPLPAGTSFVVRDVSTEDAYYSTRAGIIGLTCTATDAGMSDNAGYIGGPATCSDGNSYYFYQAVVDVLASKGASKSLGTLTTGPESASIGSLPKGSRFIVTEVSTEDAYYGSIPAGLKCVADEGMSRSEGAYWSGPAMCDGSSKYFFQVAFNLDQSAVAPVVVKPMASSAESASVSAMPAGTRFVVREVSTGDAYYGNDFSGLHCTAGDGFTRSDGMYWGGPAMCDDGDKYFYQVAFDLDHSAPSASYVAPAVAGDRFTGPWLPKKTNVIIVDVSSADAFYGARDGLVGQLCTVHSKDGIASTGASGDGWMGGTLKCSGIKLDFYQVAVQTAGY